MHAVPSTLNAATAEALHAGQNRVLEMIIAGAPLREIVTVLAQLMESLCADMSCTVLLVDSDGRRLRSFVAPQPLAEFAKLVDGLPIAEGFGSCGTAAARKQMVVTGDVAADPLWGPYREAAVRNGLAACWSMPILAHGGTLLGTFAMYYRQPRVPKDEERELINVASRLAGLAIERKQSADALRRADAKYRSIFEQAVDGIFQITPEGRVIEANPAFAKMFGYDSAEALMGEVQDISQQLCVQPAQFAELSRALRAGGTVERWEMAIRHRGGKSLWIALDARLTCAADGQTLCYEGIARDVTERKRLEQQFLQSQKMEAFGQLAGGVAHDFNNLLTVILGNLSMIRLGDMPPAQMEAALDESYRAAERAATLTAQLLTFSRRNRAEPKDLDLNEVVTNAAKMLRRLIGEHIALDTELSSEDVRVRADSALLEQALMNLALNSRDAMPKGGALRLSLLPIDLDAAAAWKSPRARPGSFVRLTVADTGTGIALADLPHIFEPFFTTKEVGKGTGLGLAMVFGIVERHEGWIDVESEVGVGTKMHVYLPRLAQGIATSIPAPQRRPPRGGTERILIVEDETEVRAMMRKVLERHGYQVKVAENGPEALARWEEAGGQFDMVVTDLVMPGGMNGREVAEALWQKRPSLPVLFCSGYSDDVLSTSERLKAGEHFLEKPFDVHVFLQRVRARLDAPAG